MRTVSVSAHFDGEHIHLDDPLEPHALYSSPKVGELCSSGQAALK